MALRQKLWKDVRPTEPRHTLIYYDESNGRCVQVLYVSSAALRAYALEFLRGAGVPDQVIRQLEPLLLGPQ